MLRLWPMALLLVACGHESVAQVFTEPRSSGGAAEAQDTPPVAEQPESVQSQVARLGPGHRCPELGAWEHPAAPCIAEADAKIRAPQLHFEPNVGTMDEASLAAVDALAMLLRAHPEIERLEIHAHTDSTDSHHY